MKKKKSAGIANQGADNIINDEEIYHDYDRKRASQLGFHGRPRQESDRQAYDTKNGQLSPSKL